MVEKGCPALVFLTVFHNFRTSYHFALDDKMNHTRHCGYEPVNIKLLIITLAKSWKTWTHSLLIQLATCSQFSNFSQIKD
jgi:hypothetical protein